MERWRSGAVWDFGKNECIQLLNQRRAHCVLIMLMPRDSALGLRLPLQRQSRCFPFAARLTIPLIRADRDGTSPQRLDSHEPTSPPNDETRTARGVAKRCDLISRPWPALAPSDRQNGERSTTPPKELRLSAHTRHVHVRYHPPESRIASWQQQLDSPHPPYISA